MRAFALAMSAAATLIAATAANGDAWFGGPPVGLFDQAGRGGPYYVAGFGDAGFNGQPRYWGGPIWVDCRGYHPPYDSYNLGRRACRRLMIVVDRP